MARVRVYLLTYRRNHLLPRALRSLLAQTFTDWVCELHNDDPADPFPAQLVRETNDPRVVLHHHEKNLGGTRTFNLVFAPVAEPYACLLEDDNWWDPSFLATLVAAADAHPEAAFVWSNMLIWQETYEGGWINTGKTIAGIMWPDQPVAGPTWFHWPQPQQRFDTLHSNGATLFRTADTAVLQIDPSIPQLAMETFRDRALAWPGLFLPQPLVNFAWTVSTYREQNSALWLDYRALLDASFLQCCPPATLPAAEFWRAASTASLSQTGNLLLHAWLAGRLREFLPLAGWRDWARVIGHAVRRPRTFWGTLRARTRYPQAWAFLLEHTARRFAATAGRPGWGPRVPLAPDAPAR